MILKRADELLKISPTPILKALINELFLFRDLFLRERDGFIDLTLFGFAFCFKFFSCNVWCIPQRRWNIVLFLYMT